VPVRLSARDAALWRTVGLSVLVGVIAGALVVAYRKLVGAGLRVAVTVYDDVARRPVLLLVWVPAAVVVALALAWMVRRVPAAGGSGIPQVKGVLVYGLRVPTWPVLAVRFVGGGLGALFGLSVGREGPCVQIGASAAEGVAAAARSRGLERDHLVTAEAAGGLAAAFNAPLSGAVFALEELHRSFAPTVLLAATSAALSADVVSSAVFGLRPVLDFGAVSTLPLRVYPWLLLLGPVAGAVAVVATRSLLGAQKAYRRLPRAVRPVIALLLLLPAGLFAPALLGGGDGLVATAESGALPVAVLGALLVGKIALTSTSFGSGVPGGIFMPLLSVGALTGAVVAGVAEHAGLPPEVRAALVLCAMAGVLSAGVQAPVTAILLVVEMTGRVVHVLPVAACALLALLTADVLRGRPIYDVLLDRFLAVARPAERGAGDAVLEVPVEAGSAAAGSTVAALGMPEGVRLVRVQRGRQRIEPEGETVLRPGDLVEVAVEVQPPGGRPGEVRSAVRSVFRQDLPDDSTAGGA
jgi:H+/Cl- antiporter ClcA